MEQRERFVRDHRLALYTMAELSVRYGISRKTGYKWLDRFDQGGRDGLGDRSRAPRRCPHTISDEVATLICEARREHPSWGPDKLLDWLGPRYPAVDFPAVSTAGDLLARKGLVQKPHRRRHDEHPGVVPIRTVHNNDLWTADFKGHFRSRDGVYCYPLTVADQHTRYLLARYGLLSTQGLGVRPVFDRLFCEYGLPDAIRTDNGVPFATTGIHSLSPLNVWWLRLGIQHQRTRPASPQENGAQTDTQDAQVGGDSPAPSPAALHRHPSADRVSRTFHREAHHERGDVSVQEAACASSPTR
jgi:putative transposase